MTVCVFYLVFAIYSIMSHSLPVGEERADIVLFIMQAGNVALNRFKYFCIYRCNKL